MDQGKELICTQVDAVSNELFAISCFLKENPETAYQEFKACEHLSSVLSEHGFEFLVGSFRIFF